MKWEQLELFPGTNAEVVSSEIGKKAAVATGTDDKPINRAAGLFWTSPKNSAVPFPADRQIAYVMKIARALDGRDERLAAKYWRTECNRLTARLQVQGFDAATIRAEIIRFGNAVSRHRTGPVSNGNGGAA